MGLRSNVAKELVAAAMLSLVLCGIQCVRACVRNGKGRSTYIWLLSVFVLFAAGGYMRASVVCRNEAVCLASMEDGQRICYEGTVEALQQRSGKWELVLRTQRVPQRLLVYLDENLFAGTERPRIGNRLRAEGTVETFDRARNPGEFDFRNYYRAKKLYFCMSADTCVLIDGACAPVRDRLFGAAAAAGIVLDEIAAPEYAGIFRAAILGDKSGLDEDIRALYQKNGISHLLAISGLHLSLVSLAVYGCFRRIGLGFGLAGAVGGIVLAGYCMLAGASSSVVRALTMALCGYLAAYLGRTYDLLSAMALSAMMICLDSPYMLTQAGVQLSFAAVIGIGGVAPEIEDWLGGRSGQSAAAAVLPAALGIQLMTVPLILWHFFEVPLYGMLLNLLVVPLMGIVLASGTAGICLGSFSAAAGRFAVGSGCGVLSLYRFLCRIFLSFPCAGLVLGRPEVWQLMCYYILLFMYLHGCRRFGCSGGKKAVLRIGLLVIGLLLAVLPLPVRGLETTFLDVGQGDGICIRTQAAVVLVDGGSMDRRSLGEDCLEPFFKSQGITRVDYAIVSHGDLDHISGLQKLLGPESDISVGCLILPEAGRGDEIYDRLAHLAGDRGTEAVWMQCGDCLNLGTLAIRCLYPEGADRAPDERNEHSLVLLAEYGRFRMLLTGDMSAEGEQRLAGKIPEIHVLKVAHHGSGFSTTDEWLDMLHPVWAVISCGEGNRYGHPHPEVIKALQERKIIIWQTALDGAIDLWTDGNQIRWKAFFDES